MEAAPGPTGLVALGCGPVAAVPAGRWLPLAPVVQLPGGAAAVTAVGLPSLPLGPLSASCCLGGGTCFSVAVDTVMVAALPVSLVELGLSDVPLAWGLPGGFTAAPRALKGNALSGKPSRSRLDDRDWRPVLADDPPAAGRLRPLPPCSFSFPCGALPPPATLLLLLAPDAPWGGAATAVEGTGPVTGSGLAACCGWCLGDSGSSLVSSSDSDSGFSGTSLDVAVALAAVLAAACCFLALALMAFFSLRAASFASSSSSSLNSSSCGQHRQCSATGLIVRSKDAPQRIAASVKVLLTPAPVCSAHNSDPKQKPSKWAAVRYTLECKTAAPRSAGPKRL